MSPQETYPGIGAFNLLGRGKSENMKNTGRNAFRGLYLAEHHWVTVSNNECPAGHVNVYNSLFHTVSDSCIAQLDSSYTVPQST